MVRVLGYNISVCTWSWILWSVSRDIIFLFVLGPGYIMVRVPGYNISVCTGPGYYGLVPGYNISVCTGPGYYGLCPGI